MRAHQHGPDLNESAAPRYLLWSETCQTAQGVPNVACNRLSADGSDHSASAPERLNHVLLLVGVSLVLDGVLRDYGRQGCKAKLHQYGLAM